MPGICKWLDILPILYRLYTSVIPLNLENTRLKVSWPTDMSPTACFSPRSRLLRVAARVPVGEGVYPGYGTGWGTGRDYTGYYPAPSQDPQISHILRLGPYPRPNEGNSEVILKVSSDMASD